jgi:outer membrane murein-binding lipoprotein Lpp
MPNLKPRAVPCKRLARETDELAALLNEAVDTLEEATRRERALAAGDSANRANLEKTYPALGDRR